MNDLVLDVMPLDEAILGFSNRWYPYAMESATAFTLEPTSVVRVASAAAFLATKWVAFASRGAADPTSSPAVVRMVISAETAAFLDAPWAAGILEGSLPDARRVPGLVGAVTRRFQQLASMS